MSIVLKEVNDPKTLNDFVNLPYILYKNNDYWVPPMKKDEKKALVAATNPAFEFCDAAFWVAYKNNKCVGRIGAIVNKLWIEKNDQKVGRFTRPEFIDDEEVSALLLSTAEKWLKEKGMETVQGPLGFSNLDHQGLLIEGHEWLPSVASDYHFEYYKKHYDKLGYDKEIGWIEFRLTFPEALPEKAFKVADMLKNRYGLKSINFTSKAEIEPYRQKVFDLFNEAFQNLFGTFKLPQKMIDF